MSGGRRRHIAGETSGVEGNLEIERGYLNTNACGGEERCGKGRGECGEERKRIGVTVGRAVD